MFSGCFKKKGFQKRVRLGVGQFSRVGRVSGNKHFFVGVTLQRWGHSPFTNVQCSSIFVHLIADYKHNKNKGNQWLHRDVIIFCGCFCVVCVPLFLPPSVVVSPLRSCQEVFLPVTEISVLCARAYSSDCRALPLHGSGS